MDIFNLGEILAREENPPPVHQYLIASVEYMEFMQIYEKPVADIIF